MFLRVAHGELPRALRKIFALAMPQIADVSVCFASRCKGKTFSWIVQVFWRLFFRKCMPALYGGYSLIHLFTLDIKVFGKNWSENFTIYILYIYIIYIVIIIINDNYPLSSLMQSIFQIQLSLPKFEKTLMSKVNKWISE